MKNKLAVLLTLLGAAEISACLPTLSRKKVAQCAQSYERCVDLSTNAAEYKQCRTDVDSACLAEEPTK